ncbi:MAG: hypothetical protein ACE5JK_05030 [Candidatus Omnitrophota bacterium]
MMNKYSQKLAFFLLFTLILVQQGCAPKLEETEEKILAHDPSFQSYIDKRNSIQEKLDKQKDAFLQNKLDIAIEIKSLKRKVAQLNEEYVASVGETKRLVAPEKRHLRQDLLEMKRQYALKKNELSTIERDISEVDSLIKRKDKLALTQEEMHSWNERLASLTERKGKIESEKDKLDKEIEITRLKIKVMSID